MAESSRSTSRWQEKGRCWFLLCVYSAGAVVRCIFAHGRDFRSSFLHMALLLLPGRRAAAASVPECITRVHPPEGLYRDCQSLEWLGHCRMQFQAVAVAVVIAPEGGGGSRSSPLFVSAVPVVAVAAAQLKHSCRSVRWGVRVCRRCLQLQAELT